MKVSLVGLMGAGKSTLGRALAARLGAPLLDLDAELERRAGCTVATLFARHGEAGFRALERAALEDVLGRPGPLVLATGGGTPCQPGAMELLLAHGPVLWLDAELETLVERAARDHANGHRRPLLLRDGQLDPAWATARLAELLAARRPYYARGHRLAPGTPDAQLSAAVQALQRHNTFAANLPTEAPMSTSTLQVALPAASAHRYPIHLEPGLPGPALAALLTSLEPRPARALIVTDDHVAPLYADAVAAALAQVGVVPLVHVLPHGEANKTADTALTLVGVALEARVSRTDLFVALGGGVIGDLTGFAAAITQRGLRFVQVPTTLLAQVDSSVGGKTGVNHSRGKNLIGAFWQPVGVVASQATLQTLPEREVRCGLAEAIKHAFIADADLLAFTLANAAALRRLEPAATAHLVEACCRVKAAVVAEDEREDPVAGRRAILNFGHTFGHAFEKLLGYGRLTHGEAVALGMVMAARLSDRLGVAQGITPRVVAALAALGLPHEPEATDLPPLHDLIEAARGDKKASGDHVRFVLLADVGQPLIRRLTWAEVAAALSQEPA